MSGLLSLGSYWTARDAGTEGISDLLTIKINPMHVILLSYPPPAHHFPRVKWDPRVSLVCQGNVALQDDQASAANR